MMKIYETIIVGVLLFMVDFGFHANVLLRSFEDGDSAWTIALIVGSFLCVSMTFFTVWNAWRKTL